MAHKGILCFLLFSMLCVGLTGCWGSIELNQRAYVLALAIDKGDTQAIKVTLFLPVPETLVKDAGEESYYAIQDEAESLYQALTVIQNRVDYQLYLGHLQMVLFGDDIVKKGIDSFVSQLQEHQISRNTQIYVVDGQASDLLEGKPPSGNSIVHYLERYLRTPAKNDLKHYIDLGIYSIQQQTPGLESAIAYIKLAEDQFIDCLGVVILKDGQKVGVLNQSETQGFNIVQGEIGSAYIPIIDANKQERAQGKLLNKSSKLELISEGNELKAVYTLTIDYTIVAFSKGEPTKEDKQLAEQYLAQQLEKKIIAAINQAQASNSDIFGMGRQLYFTNFAKWRTLEWSEAFPKVNKEINIEMSYKRTRKEKIG